jgi:hypothetical protein
MKKLILIIIFIININSCFSNVINDYIILSKDNNLIIKSDIKRYDNIKHVLSNFPYKLSQTNSKNNLLTELIIKKSYLNFSTRYLLTIKKKLNKFLYLDLIKNYAKPKINFIKLIKFTRARLSDINFMITSEFLLKQIERGVFILSLSMGYKDINEFFLYSNYNNINNRFIDYYSSCFNIKLNTKRNDNLKNIKLLINKNDTINKKKIDLKRYKSNIFRSIKRTGIIANKIYFNKNRKFIYSYSYSDDSINIIKIEKNVNYIFNYARYVKIKHKFKEKRKFKINKPKNYIKSKSNIFWIDTKKLSVQFYQNIKSLNINDKITFLTAQGLHKVKILDKRIDNRILLSSYLERKILNKKLHDIRYKWEENIVNSYNLTRYK